MILFYPMKNIYILNFFQLSKDYKVIHNNAGIFGVNALCYIDLSFINKLFIEYYR